MDKKLLRSRSVRYRSAKARVGRSVCVDKCSTDQRDDGGWSAMTTVVASEGGSLSSAGLIVDMLNPDDSAVDRLRVELQEACKERLKAAEYGLVLLEEKDFLQQEVDRLEVQFEGSQQDIDNLNQQLQESRTEATFFKQQIASLRQDLVEQCDEREEELVKDSRDLLQQLSNVRRSLKSESEQRKLLEEELEKQRRNERDLQNQLLIARQHSTEETKVTRMLKQSNVELQEQLSDTSLSEDHSSLHEENEWLRKENAELARQVSCLCEELDTIQDESVHVANRENVEDETEKLSGNAVDVDSERRVTPAGSPAPNNNDSEERRSSGAKRAVVSSSSSSHSANILAGLGARLSDGSRDVDLPCFPPRTFVSRCSSSDCASTRAFDVRERELLQQASLLRAELVAALTEVEGVRSMSADAGQAASKQVARLQEELELVRQREEAANRQSMDHEHVRNNRQRLAHESEDVLSHLSGELRALNADLVKVARLAVSLGNLKNKKKGGSAPGVGGATEEDASHCHSNVQLLNTIRQQVRSVKSALDSVLMQTLQKTAAKISQSSPLDANLCDEHKETLQGDLRKAQEQVSAKSHESSQLRSLLKMARITSQANLERERSNREQQTSMLTLKIAALEKLIEKLHQDSRDFVQERSVFQTRCDEFISQLAQQKKEASALRDESKLLDGMLNKAIAQKLSMTEKLENYEFEVQRKNIAMLHAPEALPVELSPRSSVSSDKGASPLSSRLPFLRGRGKREP